MLYDLNKYITDDIDLALLKEIQTKNPIFPLTQPPQGEPVAKRIEGLTNAQHHSLNMISSTQIKYLLTHDYKSWHRKYVLRDLPPEEFNENFLLGTLTHLAIEDYELYKKSVLVKTFHANRNEDDPDDPEIIGKRTLAEILGLEVKTLTIPVISEKTGKPLTPKIKTIWPEFNRTKDGAFIKADGSCIYLISQKESDTIEAHVTNVWNHPIKTERLEMGTAEITGVARCPLTGLWLQVREDLQGEGWIDDWKTSKFSTAKDVTRSVEGYGYDIQVAFYLYVNSLIAIQENKPQPEKMNLTFFNKDSLYNVWNISLSERTIYDAFRILVKLLIRIAYCQITQKFPPLDEPGEVEVEVSSYVVNDRINHILQLDKSAGIL
jgi:hypothetical protein